MREPHVVLATLAEDWQNLYNKIQKARLDKQHLYLNDDEVHLLYGYLDDPSLTTLPQRTQIDHEEHPR